MPSAPDRSSAARATLRAPAESNYQRCTRPCTPAVSPGIKSSAACDARAINTWHPKMDSAEEKLPPTSAIPENPDPVSPAVNASPSSTTAHSLRNEIRVWTRDLLIAIGLALVIIVFLYQPVKVEGTSMAPLLSDQERIFINKFVYRFE